jgi:hypothetical protein
LQVVLELFDKATTGPEPVPFTEADRQLARTAADIGTELLRQALAERQTQRVLFDAMEAALRAGDEVARSLGHQPAPRPEDPPPPAVLRQLEEGLSTSADSGVDAGVTLRLAEAIRVLALRHGTPAVEHCILLVEDLRRLLDRAVGNGEARP